MKKSNCNFVVFNYASETIFECKVLEHNILVQDWVRTRTMKDGVTVLKIGPKNVAFLRERHGL